ncbi:MAG: hypothetical protein ACR2PK_09245 [Acidimicrobiales bacterium]
MAAVALNLLALMLVVGSSWLAMMWLANRAHSRRYVDNLDAEEEWVITRVELGDPCPECDGVGAKQKLGGLETCELCEGRGEITSLPS